MALRHLLAMPRPSRVGPPLTMVIETQQPWKGLGQEFALFLASFGFADTGTQVLTEYVPDLK